MSPALDQKLSRLLDEKHRWLVSGAAGFIGSHLCAALLSHGQEVLALDNFSTGNRLNQIYLENLRSSRDGKLNFVEGDICDHELMLELISAGDLILHQAALGSVPRSMTNPLATNQANVNGFLSILNAAAERGAARLVFASSSSVYGDNALLPKQESATGKALSPYALSKWIDELYADLFVRVFSLSVIGLRYFNVFGPRQDPAGPYAAVIPRWINKLIKHESPVIYGDGLTSRDFCFVDNVVFANIAAALSPQPLKFGVYNIAVGESTSLLRLFECLVKGARTLGLVDRDIQPIFEKERPGDIKDSLADISLAEKSFDYEALIRVEEGLMLTLNSFMQQ